MPLYFVKDDITRMSVDAIVNAANSSLMGGGGVDGAIHRAAGPDLDRQCAALGGCETGRAKLTSGCRLPVKFIIHTVGPVWRGGSFGEREKLISCYRSSLELAAANGCLTVAFPLISAGVYGYPKEKAINAAVEAITGFLTEKDMTVYLVFFRELPFGPDQLGDIGAYIAGAQAAVSCEQMPTAGPTIRGKAVSDISLQPEERGRHGLLPPRKGAVKAPRPAGATAGNTCGFGGMPGALDSELSKLDESFSQTLLRLIDEKGLTDAQCYKLANVDRRLFSKIRSEEGYRPSKATVLAFAVALKLNVGQTNDLLRRAGFTLSHSSKADIIVEYFITRGDFDIYTINEALLCYDQPLLGSV